MGKRGPKKGEGYKPTKDIDWKKLDAMCKIMCTEDEIASILEMSIQSLNEKIKAEKGKTFFDYYKEKSAEGKMSLRRSQYSAAIGRAMVIEDGEVKEKGTNPNITMQIWLGKQLLGQKEQVAIEHSGGIDVASMTVEQREKRLKELREKQGQ